MSVTDEARNASCRKGADAGGRADWRASLTRALAGLSADEASFRRRGFAVCDRGRRDRLEEIGHVFIAGYNRALAGADGASARPFQALKAELDTVARPLRGFAYEGAAMGLGVCDAMPWTRADGLRLFLEDAGDRHAYLLHVGAGWAMARLPWRRKAIFRALDPLLAWLAIDGWGFHDVYFSPARLGGGSAGRRPGRTRAYDQGAGRALWFVAGGDMDAALRLVSNQNGDRRADLLSGLALAMAYTGIAAPDDLRALKHYAETAMPDGAAAIAQGAAFAVEARARAGNPLAGCDRACAALSGQTPGAALAIVRAHRPARSDIEKLEAETGRAAYAVWRHRVQAAFCDPARGATMEETLP